MTKNIGVYSLPPTGLQKARIGVPSFAVADKGLSTEVAKVAADQIATLCAQSERFQVIERAQLGQLLKEQGLEGIVEAGHLARAAQVRGVEYLLIGKVTNLRVKSEQSEVGFDLGSIPIPGTAGGVLGLFGLTKTSMTVSVECGVDLRLTDPTTGITLAANFSEFQRADTVAALGLKALGAKADAESSEAVAADNHGKILRLALDDCLRKMLPCIDAGLLARQKTLLPTGD